MEDFGAVQTIDKGKVFGGVKHVSPIPKRNNRKKAQVQV